MKLKTRIIVFCLSASLLATTVSCALPGGEGYRNSAMKKTNASDYAANDVLTVEAEGANEETTSVDAVLPDKIDCIPLTFFTETNRSGPQTILREQAEYKEAPQVFPSFPTSVELPDYEYRYKYRGQATSICLASAIDGTPDGTPGGTPLAFYYYADNDGMEHLLLFQYGYVPLMLHVEVELGGVEALIDAIASREYISMKIVDMANAHFYPALQLFSSFVSLQNAEMLPVYDAASLTPALSIPVEDACIGYIDGENLLIWNRSASDLVVRNFDLLVEISGLLMKEPIAEPFAPVRPKC